jgi:hypothetical protein
MPFFLQCMATKYRTDRKVVPKRREKITNPCRVTTQKIEYVKVSDLATPMQYWQDTRCPPAWTWSISINKTSLQKLATPNSYISLPHSNGKDRTEKL